MERSFAVAHEELRSLGFETSLDDSPPPLTSPPSSVPVSYRATEPVSAPVTTVANTVVPPPTVDPYQLILRQRLLDVETENSILRAASASRFSTSTPIF